MPYYRISPAQQHFELEAVSKNDAFDRMLTMLFEQGKGITALVEIVEIPKPKDIDNGQLYRR